MHATDPRHGTYAGAVAHYAAKERPCPSCMEAKRTYSRRHHKERLMGRARWVDTTLLRRHVGALMASGMTLADIARAANVAPETLRHIRNGGKRVNIKTFQALAQVQRGDSETFMPRESTARKIKALAAMGYELRWIAEQLDTRPQALANIVHEYRPNSGRVTRKTWDAVDELYQAHHMTVGPSVRARGMAARNGWAPPLAYDDIDDLTCAPRGWDSETRDRAAVDDVAVERVLIGDFRVQLTRAERYEVVRRWQGSDNELERITGWNVARLRREMARPAQEVA